jgi:DNA polymerase
MRAAVDDCRGCPLYARATQGVFGRGPAKASLMLIGEQPGNDEDLAGEPFIGPSGKLLDRALAEAGIDRDVTYVTNAVKHFNWEPSGTRRMHKKPGARDIDACRPWLAAELAAVRPQVVVALGATAAQSLFGKSFRVTVDRGKAVVVPFAPHAFGTIHPSAILRQRTAEDRERELHLFVRDLKLAARAISRPSAR